MNASREAETRRPGDDPALEALARGLGPFGFRWLVACAAFPVLRLPITLHLGAALKRADGEAPPSEEDVLALASLPWFRQGWMPEGLRRALLDRQSEQDRATVRDALACLAFTAIDADQADSAGRVTVARVQQPPRGFAEELEGWRAGLPLALAQRDRALETSFEPGAATRRDIMVLGAGAILGAVGIGVGSRIRSQLPSHVQPRALDQGAVAQAAIDQTGTLAAIGNRDGRVTLGRIGRQDPIQTTSGSGAVLALGFESQNVFFATTSEIYRWCLDCAVTSGSTVVSRPRDGRIVAAKSSADGSTLAYLAAGETGSFTFSFYHGGDVNDGIALHETSRNGDDSLPAIAIGATGQFAAVSDGGQIVGFDLRTSDRSRIAFDSRLRMPGALLAAGDDSRGVPLLAVANVNGTIQVVQTASKARSPQSINSGIGPFTFLDVGEPTADGAPRLIAGARDGRIAVLAPEGVLLSGHRGAIRAARFSTDFTLLASGSDDGTGRVWRLADGESIRLETGKPVLQVAFSEDELSVVTLSADGAARIWPCDSLLESPARARQKKA